MSSQSKGPQFGAELCALRQGTNPFFQSLGEDLKPSKHATININQELARFRCKRHENIMCFYFLF